MKVRQPLQLYSAVREDLGELETWRALPLQDLPHLEPFLFLNHHGLQVFPPGNDGLPFAPHPHRGFETVTIVLAGDVVHRDSAGHESTIHAGGVQWMTAGRGVFHSELSSPEFCQLGGELELLQIWINLPGAWKRCEPRYFGFERSALPELELDEGRVRLSLVAGAWLHGQGPVPMLACVHLCFVRLEPGGRFELPLPGDHQLFFYVARGELMANSWAVKARQLLSFGDEGELLIVQAVQDSILVLAHGPKQNEPIVAHGPFVMNSEQEIWEALQDYRDGRIDS